MLSYIISQDYYLVFEHIVGGVNINNINNIEI